MIVLLRCVLSLTVVYLMWRHSGWPVGVLALVVFVNAELAAVLNRLQRERIVYLEQFVKLQTESLLEAFKRREQYRERSDRHWH